MTSMAMQQEAMVRFGGTYHIFLAYVSGLRGYTSKIWPEEYWLVVEPYPSEKYEFENWDDDIPN